MSDIKNGPAEKEAPDSKKQIREKRKAISKWPVVLAVFCAAAAIFMLSYRYYAQEKARRLTEAGNAAKASGLAGTPSNGIIELDGKKIQKKHFNSRDSLYWRGYERGYAAANRVRSSGAGGRPFSCGAGYGQRYGQDFNDSPGHDDGDNAF